MTHRALVYYAQGRWFAAVRSRTSDGRLHTTHAIGGYGWDQWSAAARAAVGAAKPLTEGHAP